MPQVSTLAIMLHLPLRKDIGIQENLFSFGPDILRKRRTLLVLRKACRIFYSSSIAFHFCTEHAINPVINGQTPYFQEGLATIRELQVSIVMEGSNRFCCLHFS
ncbi:hypothetical protein GDO78_013086 [Eleutherodactylus coqui]|uniref:Uncharacterized protein n=1 Tax=Eleutherodactylus coqui TaxID=57060 RepID=A0A8J6K359_ELECQ|nr:hypothetical protein GDO78_013086 [Eleutherodactylus coqui]